VDRHSIIKSHTPFGVVVIGRNEGNRLIRCLRTLKDQFSGPLVYVDSGSSDGSVEFARSIGVDVIELDMSIPFTMGRGRNAGWRFLDERYPEIQLVQFVDGDCEIVDGWLEYASEVMNRQLSTVAVFGRLRERFPDATVYNHIADMEWNRPVGEASACGGIAMLRLHSLKEVGGYREDMIAGEEAELCVRMKRNGGRIERLDAEMALHDIAMTRFGQWWKRSIRGGHAYAEGAALQGKGPERHNVRQVQRTVLWGMIVPGLFLLSLVITMITGWWPVLVVTVLVSFLLLIQTYRIYLGYRKRGFEERSSRWCAMFVTIAKVAQAIGVLQYWLNRRLNRRTKLIEYREDGSGNISPSDNAGEMVS